MKQFLILFLGLTLSNLNGQQVSNRPFEMFWHRYVLEFNDTTIKKNKIKTIAARRVVSKTMDKKPEDIIYKVEFNSAGLPTKYLFQKQFSIRNDYRYNPFWRMRNKYPVIKSWLYELDYDSLNRLSRVTETNSITNDKYRFFEILAFEYDAAGRLASQKIYNVADGFRDIPFNIDKYEMIYLGDTLNGIIHYVQEKPVDTVICFHNKRFDLVEFNFGDSSETFFRNVPFDRNETLFMAGDKNSTVTRDTKGLVTSP